MRAQGQKRLGAGEPAKRRDRGLPPKIATRLQKEPFKYKARAAEERSRGTPGNATTRWERTKNRGT